MVRPVGMGAGTSRGDLALVHERLPYAVVVRVDPGFELGTLGQGGQGEAGRECQAMRSEPRFDRARVRAGEGRRHDLRCSGR